MTKLGLVTLGFLLMVMPFVNADVINPGYRVIGVENKITNLNDYPDYVFVSGGDYSAGFGVSQCPIYKIESDGLVTGDYYKLCNIAVYAIKKDYFNESILNRPNVNSAEWNSYEQFVKDYFNSANVKLVINDLKTFAEVPESSTQKSIIYEHTLDLSNKNAVSKKETIRNDLIYVYIIVPIVALVVIGVILLRRRRNA